MTVAPAKGVRVADWKSLPMASPAGAVTGVTRGVMAMASVAVAPTVTPEAAKVTVPVVWRVALANGTPTSPVLEANGAPSMAALNHRVPLPSLTVAPVGAGWPPEVTT